MSQVGEKQRRPKTENLQLDLTQGFLEAPVAREQ